LWFFDGFLKIIFEKPLTKKIKKNRNFESMGEEKSGSQRAGFYKI
jgi:hypothetical protein